MNGKQTTKATVDVQPLLTPEDVAGILKLHVKTVQKRLLTGEIPNIVVCGSKRRGTRRIRPADLSAYIESNRDGV